MNGEPYRLKHCNACHESYINKKEAKKLLTISKLKNKKVKLPIKTDVQICIKCKEPFEKQRGKNGRPFIKCPKCRKIHSIEQTNSSKKLYREDIKKAKVSILDEVTSTISKEEIINAVAKELVNKLYNNR
jgi:DNA-directed RNA polymerase subunit M/transcription elongation factor TFIIS